MFVIPNTHIKCEMMNVESNIFKYKLCCRLKNTSHINIKNNEFVIPYTLIKYDVLNDEPPFFNIKWITSYYCEQYPNV